MLGAAAGDIALVGGIVVSYTDLYGQPQGVPFYFVNKIREALIAEVAAINGYARHIANSHMEEINAVWRSIIADEKEHYGLFLALVHRYDPTQYQLYIKHSQDAIAVAPLQPFKPEYDRQLILNNVREDAKGEFEAVILYDQLLHEAPYQDIKDVFQYVIHAEKEHAEHLTRVLLLYDTDQYNDLV
jgi:rubrerythrin